jgi:hypothetical protein
MALSGSINGVKAVVRWGYYNAAAIQGYTVTRKGQEWSVRAAVVISDAFKLSQRPLMFVAPYDKGSWRWPILEITRFEQGSLSARLGPPEE